MEDYEMYDFDEIMTTDREVADAIKAEMERQNSHIELIAHRADRLRELGEQSCDGGYGQPADE